MRRQFIGEIANDEWVDRFPRDASDDDFARMSKAMEEACARFVTGSTDPHELHLFARKWNWDGDVAPIRALVRNPACDQGTALMVYWLAQPEYQLRYTSRGDVPEYEHEVFDLVSELEPRLVTGDFATAQIAYDPHADGLVSGPPANAKRALPPEVYEPVLGQRS